MVVVGDSDDGGMEVVVLIGDGSGGNVVVGSGSDW